MPLLACDVLLPTSTFCSTARLGRARAQPGLSILHKCSKRARCLRKSAHNVDNLTIAHHVVRLEGRVVRLPRAAVLAHRWRRALLGVHPGALGVAEEEVLLEEFGRLAIHVGRNHLAHDTLQLGRVQRLVVAQVPGVSSGAQRIGVVGWARSIEGAEVVHRGRLSTELHDVLMVCLKRAVVEGCICGGKAGGANRVRVFRSCGCADRRGTLVDELGLQRGRHRGSRTRRRQRGGANVQRESGRGDDGQHSWEKKL